MRQVIQRAAAVGHRPPRFEVLSWLMRGAGALGAVSASCADRTWASWCGPAWATYWFSDAEGRAELGYAPRALDDGLASMLQATSLTSCG